MGGRYHIHLPYFENHRLFPFGLSKSVLTDTGMIFVLWLSLPAPSEVY